MERRTVIVNADDFGMSEGVNRGIARAREHGVVTGASLMVERPGALEAARYARANSFDVGLHVDLGEWALEHGEWVARRTVVALDDSEAVAGAVSSQLEWFRELVGRDPTHLDSHQHVHLDQPARSIFEALARDLDVPLRQLSREVRYSGAFYGQGPHGEPLHDAIGVEALVALIGSLAPGVTELACHPGEDPDPDDAYGPERIEEVATLCDPRVRAAIDAAGIELRSFSNLPRRQAVP